VSTQFGPEFHAQLAALSKCCQMISQHVRTRVHTGMDAGSAFLKVVPFSTRKIRCEPEPLLQSFVVGGYVDTLEVSCPLLCHLGITHTASVFPVHLPLLTLLRYDALWVGSAFGPD
jgi:hypothetical protein